MASDHALASPPSIDEDLWPEILKRLPVKYLCRFRSVCRSWNSLISSPRFISDHLNSTSATAKFLFRTNNSGDLVSYALDHSEIRVKYRDFPFRTLGLRVADVIHGVICISRSSFNFCNGTAILYNPAIHKHFTLPWPPTLPQSSNDDSYFVDGFGFDRSKNDFKVARIRSSGVAFEVPDCQVFSVQDGRWNNQIANSVNLSCQIPIMSTSCFADGAIHWIAEVEGSIDYHYTLLVFDCEGDELSAMDLPEEVRCAGDSFKCPEVFVREDGLLAVLQFRSEEEGDCVMWVMKSYGVVSTWRKVFYIDRLHLYQVFSVIFEEERIMANNRSPCNFKESLLLMDVGEVEKPYYEERMNAYDWI